MSSTKTPYAEIKEKAWRANMEIPERGLAMYTWGNVSQFDADKAVFAIKPSGVPYDELRADDMVVLDLEGTVVEGKLNPSSDTPTHRILYREFAVSGVSKGKIGGITHTHSPYAVSWAQAGRSIPLFGTTHADHSPYGVVCTRFLTRASVSFDYEGETGNLIAETFKNPPADFFATTSSRIPSAHGGFMLVPHENPMVLVAGHGPFTWGEDAHKSVYNAAVLEEVAKMALFTLRLNPECPPLADYIVNKHYERKHGENAYYGQKK